MPSLYITCHYVAKGRYKIERMNKQTSKQAKYGVTRVEYQKKWNIHV